MLNNLKLFTNVIVIELLTLFIVICCNFVGNTINKDIRKLFRKNIYIQYFLLFLVIYKTSNYLEDKLFANIKINPLYSIVYSFLVLILYIYFNKLNYKFIIFIIFLIIILYFLFNVNDYYNFM